MTDEDVVAIAADDTAVLYFDGSDVGLGGLAIDAFATLDDGSLLFSFTAPGTVDGVAGTVDDSDIVRFEPTTLGVDTAGTFSLWFDGSDVGLTTNNEDLDAIDVVGGKLYVSTTRLRPRCRASSGSNADADILAFTWTSLGGDDRRDVGPVRGHERCRPFEQQRERRRASARRSDGSADGQAPT